MLASPAALAILLAITPSLRAQSKPEDIKLLQPTVDKAAGTVTLPAAFWNPHACDWVEVALSGKPSDFLHETVLCVTTTRSLLEQALRDAGCRDGDAWADSVSDFPRVRGDRLLITLTFTRDGKKETYSLDELLEFQQWGTALGPFGFDFRGDPDHANLPRKPGEGETDATKILKDDPQIALQFKGLQSVSQSFADHPLAYDNWEYEQMTWWRNAAVLPQKVYDSNGDIPVTMTIKHVTEEQLLTESAKLWHDKAAAENILKQVPTAQQTDKEKDEYMKLRGELNKPHQNWSLQQQNDLESRLAVLAADIERDYAALDAAWVNWSFDHIKWETDDAESLKALKDLAAKWREHMNLEVERTAQIALAQQAASDEQSAANDPASPDLAQLAALRGKEIEARSRALLAENKQPADRWAAERARLDPKDPRDSWIKEVTLHTDLTAARQSAATAGIAYGQALQKPPPPDSATIAKLANAYQLATIRATLAEKQLALTSIDFEISKRDSFPADPDLPGLKKQREQLQSEIKALATVASRPE